MTGRLRLHRLAAFCLALLLAAPLAALPLGAQDAPPPKVPLSSADYPLGSWKMFHANTEHTGEGATTVPPGGHVVWSYADPVNRSSDTPEGGAVVDAGRAYAGLGNRMTAVNATTGAKLWTFGSSGRILSTPALWNGSVYFGAGGSPGADNFYALNTTTGGLVWKANESASLGLVQFVHVSPTVANGLVYYGSYTYWFYARNAGSGSLAWSANLSSEVLASPAESGGVVYVASAGIHNPVLNGWDVLPRLWAFDALTGMERWNQTVNSGHLIASPVVSGGMVYVATAGFTYATIDVNSGYVLAFYAGNGTLAWTSPDIGRVMATPAVAGGAMYVATAGQQGAVTGTDARLRKLDLSASGAVLWSQPVGSSAAMYAAPAVVGSLVVVAARDGAVGVWTTGGVNVWTYVLPDEVTSPPAVVNELIIVPCLDGAIYAFGAQPDFSVVRPDIELSDLTPHVGEPLGLTALVRNVGDKRGSGTVEVLVNVSGNVTSLAVVNITDLDFASAFLAAAPYTAQTSGLHEFVALVSNVTPQDGNASNDRANLTVNVLPRLDGWRGRYSDEHGSNFLETWTPLNNIPKWSNGSFGATGSGAIAFDSTVVVARNDTLFAFARENGSDLRWAYLAPKPIVGTPALVAGYVVFSTANPGDATGNASFIDPDTGALEAVVGLPSRPTTSPVPLDTQFLLGLADRVVSVSVANRTVDREFANISVPPSLLPAIRTEPVAAGGYIFVLSSVGEVHAFDAVTGVEPAGFPFLLDGGWTDVPLVVGGGSLFVVNGSTKLSAFPIAPLSAAPTWTVNVSEPIGATIAFGYGRVFVSTASGNVSAFSAGSGARVWNRTLAPPQGSSAVRAAGNDTVFAGGTSLFALSATDGQTRWQYDLSALGAIVGPAAMATGTLHLQTSSGALLTLGMVPGAPPITNLSSPREGASLRVGEAVTFSAEGTFDPDAQNLTYLWDFGDGSYGNANVTQHTYSFGGTFLVRLTVTDEQGLSSSRTALVQVILNQAPVLGGGSIDPPAGGRIWLDSTIWTFHVNYTDANGDPPAVLRVNISNEPEPLKDMVPAGPGPYQFNASVSYVWSGSLLSGRHNYTFFASDGLANVTTPASPNLDVYRLERIEGNLVTMLALYVGQGSSNISAGDNIAAPAGYALIDRLQVTLPTNSTQLQWVNLTYKYGIADINLSLFLEETIRFFWFDRTIDEWVELFSSDVLADEDLAWANATSDGLYGLFGKPKLTPPPPVAKIEVRDGRSVFAPGERVEFSGAKSLDPGGLPITFFWEFGDGNTSTEMNPIHVYNQTGNIVVRLTVTNSFGLAHTATYPLTVRTEASASTFLGIAASIIGALFVLFVLWPAWRRRSQVPPPPRELSAPLEADGEPPLLPSAPPSEPKKSARPPTPRKSTTVPVDDDQAKVLNDLDREFEQSGGSRGPP